MITEQPARQGVLSACNHRRRSYEERSCAFLSCCQELRQPRSSFPFSGYLLSFFWFSAAGVKKCQLLCLSIGR